MPKLKVNGAEVEFQAGMTVLQACEIAGEEIPRFCYHERLKIAGNCRMCLVQIEGGPPKPAASCAMPAVEGMVVHTNTPMVKKAREGVMEFLLINHPLDCPICDQAGECDLQDQAMAYGRGQNRYDDVKRAVPKKYLGPLIETAMNRCIHCTRCVRFIDQVAGVSELGAVGRGEKMEITTYVEKSLTSELSGNIIDLCPVGALTSRPYAFQGRPWELRKTESIDVMDAVGSNIRIDARGNEVLRILPRLHEEINEEWISDKTRFAYDGLKLQRLDRPYVRKKGKLVEVSWDEAYQTVVRKLKATDSDRIAALTGDLVDCESVYALKTLLQHLGSPHMDCRQEDEKLNATNRASYLFNTTIAGIEQADLCLLVGVNPRVEAPMLNARIRKAHINNGLSVSLVGSTADLTYLHENLGDSPEILQHIWDGAHPFSTRLRQAKRPMIVVGMAALKRNDGEAILHVVEKITQKYALVKEGWNGFNVLHRAAGRVGALDLGFVPQMHGKSTKEIVEAAEKGKIQVLYLLGADEIAVDKLGEAFVIYQGHHGDKGAHRADVILPGAAYTEKEATYVNTEGRVQRSATAVYPVGQAKEDCLIIQTLSHMLGFTTTVSDTETVRAQMLKDYPILKNLDAISASEWRPSARQGLIGSEPLQQDIQNFYMTNSITRASRTMAKCAQEILGRKHQQEAA